MLVQKRSEIFVFFSFCAFKIYIFRILCSRETKFFFSISFKAKFLFLESKPDLPTMNFTFARQKKKKTHLAPFHFLKNDFEETVQPES